MKHLLAILLTGIAFAFGTASTAQAHDRSCYRSYSSHNHGYSSGYSSGYCQPRYYQSYNNCQPRYYQSYNYCQPRYYSPPCYSSRSYGFSAPGISFFFRR